MKLGFIGAGNMAGVIIGSILKKGILREADIAISDIDPDKQERYRKAGHPVYTKAAALVSACGTIVLSVKPQQVAGVLAQTAAAISPDKVLVSIAAGITAEFIKSAAGIDCKVMLAMPNTPMQLGLGVTALARIAPTTPEEFTEIRRLFDAGGFTEEIPADKMVEIIPVIGSSPAFLYRFAEIISREAEANGIDSDAAIRLFCRTAIGSFQLLLDSGKTPGSLIREVCSPGGTTLEGMKALEEYGFDKAIAEAFTACVRRGRELSGNK